MTEADQWIYFFKNGFEPGNTAIGDNYVGNQLVQLLNDNLLKELSEEYHQFDTDLKETLQKLLNEYRMGNYGLDERYVKESAPKANLTLLLFEKEIKVYPYTKINEDDIDLGAIEKELPNIAFNLFRTWVKTAQKTYPEKEFSIVDEGKLIESLKMALKSALYIFFTHKDYIRNGLSKKELHCSDCLELISARLNE